MFGLLDSSPAIAALPAEDRRVVKGLRVWAVTTRVGRCPLRAVAEQLGSFRAAAHMHLLLVGVGGAWPDPFAVCPPCCSRMTHDEAAFIDMIRFARRSDRPAFDRLLAEMIDAEARARLFLSASVLTRVLRQVSPA